MERFFLGFGDEIVKLAAEPGVRSRAAGAFSDMNRELQMRRPMRTHEAERMGGTRVAPKPAPKMPLLDPYPKSKPDTPLPKPKISLQQFKAQQQARRQKAQGDALAKLPGIGPAPKGKGGDPYADLTADVPISKELAQHKHRQARAFRRANPKIFKGIKPSKDEGRAEYVAQEATRKTLGSKMTAKEIVDRYALGIKPKRRGKKRTTGKGGALPPPRTAKGGGAIPKSLMMMSPREQARSRRIGALHGPPRPSGLLSQSYKQKAMSHPGFSAKSKGPSEATWRSEMKKSISRAQAKVRARHKAEAAAAAEKKRQQNAASRRQIRTYPSSHAFKVGKI